MKQRKPFVATEYIKRQLKFHKQMRENELALCMELHAEFVRAFNKKATAQKWVFTQKPMVIGHNSLSMPRVVHEIIKATAWLIGGVILVLCAAFIGYLAAACTGV